MVGRSANQFGRLAQEAENLGDQVGGNDPGTANLLYAASGRLRALAQERADAFAKKV